MNDYDTPEHRAYVEAGNCPAVTITKVWCNDRKNHAGRCWSTRMVSKDKAKRHYWEPGTALAVRR